MSWPASRYADAGNRATQVKRALMVQPVVILGSARPDGETKRAVEIAFPDGVETIIVGHQHIGGYDYGHRNDADDFRLVVDAMLQADAIIFATPVYWYAMSAPLKTFFDRLTDLLETAKDKGRALAGKEVWLIATGIETELPEGFEVPFARTAEYFAMHYRGVAYVYTGDDAAMRRCSEMALAAFGVKIFENAPPSP